MLVSHLRLLLVLLIVSCHDGSNALAQRPAPLRSIPGVAGRPTLALPNQAPTAAELKLPAAIKPGMRISYHAGDSVIAGVASKLQPIPGKNGQWFDPKTGQNYNVTNVPTSGGVGYVQVNVVAATPELVAFDTRNFPIVDVQRGIAASGGGAAVTGDAASAGAYWIHPALLALVSAEGGVPQPEGAKISRIKYTAGQKQFNALSISNDYASGFDHSVYDLDSGLLLSRAGSMLGDGVSVIDPRTGQVTRGKGTTVIYHTIFVEAREVKVPWGDQAMPEWVAKGRQLNYSGSYATTTPMGPLPGLGLARAVQIGNVTNGIALARVSTRADLGAGLPPQDSHEDRCFGSLMLNPLWISPKSIEKLQPNQVLDEDRLTGFRVTFQGAQNGAGAFVEQGPVESTQYVYDLRSGVLSGVRSTRQQGTGQVQSQLTLTQQ